VAEDPLGLAGQEPLGDLQAGGDALLVAGARRAAVAQVLGDAVERQGVAGLLAQPGTEHPDGQRVPPAPADDGQRGGGIVVHPAPADGAGEQLDRVALGQRAEPAADGGLQPAERCPGGHDHGAAGAAGQQGAHLLGVGRPLDQHQGAPVGEQGTVAPDPFEQVVGDLPRPRAEGLQQLAERVAGADGTARLAEVDGELDVGEQRPGPSRQLQGDGRSADPRRPVDHHHRGGVLLAAAAALEDGLGVGQLGRPADQLVGVLGEVEQERLGGAVGQHLAEADRHLAPAGLPGEDGVTAGHDGVARRLRGVAPPRRHPALLRSAAHVPLPTSDPERPVPTKLRP
jgi:hypothetical protein